MLNGAILHPSSLFRGNGVNPKKCATRKRDKLSAMIIGVPKEVKDHEARVALVPSGVTALREAGHEVLVQSTAGNGSALPDSEYESAGATVVPGAAEVWRKADIVVKVKEPQPSEYSHLRPGLTLFTYLH